MRVEINVMVVHNGGIDPGLSIPYGPISLLNINYRILTSMAGCFYSFLSKYIMLDQTGFLKGKKMFRNIRRFINLINMANVQQHLPLFSLIRQEKAFNHIKRFIYRMSWKKL